MLRIHRGKTLVENLGGIPESAMKIPFFDWYRVDEGADYDVRILSFPETSVTAKFIYYARQAGERASREARYES